LVSGRPRDLDSFRDARSRHKGQTKETRNQLEKAMPATATNNGTTTTNGTPAATQENRPLKVTLPETVGKDVVVLLVGFTASEALSRLFSFHLDLLVKAANRTAFAFEKLLGQSITVELEVPGSPTPRYFNGLCSRLSQGERDQEFTPYRMELVPKLWLLGKQAQSRIFQHQTVPAILSQVLKDGYQLDVVGLNTLDGPWQPRDYCVQYRETDLNFVSRLLEEEGIFYYFTHTAQGHQMVVGNQPSAHQKVPEQNPVPYPNSARDKTDYFISSWQKVQELRSGKYTLWDHSFEKPESNFWATSAIAQAVQVGQVSHPLQVGQNDQLEIYDYPGEYAQRFDGINPGGGDRSTDVAKIFKDNQRTVDIRMEEEAVPGLLLQGASNCRRFAAGHQFDLTTAQGSLQQQFQADGSYVLTGVQHTARQSNPRSGNGNAFHYHNSFTCIPLDLPFRPARQTPKPVLAGTQTAVVVGPKGQEISVDKYGRVKVQFHWDRQGKKNENSSCWIRVAQFWVGKRFGAHFWPRIGQEVVVAFEEGDPDQPLIVGSVYNAENPPPYDLPEHQTCSGLKTRSTLNGTPQNFNEIRFEDKKGQEEIYVQAERNLNTVVKSCEGRAVGGSRETTIYHGEKLTVKDDGRETRIENGPDQLIVEKGPRLTTVMTADDRLYVNQGDALREVAKGNDTVNVFTGNATRVVPNGAYTVNAKTINLMALEHVVITVGGSQIIMTPELITIISKELKATGSTHVQVTSQVIDLN
jgi:type VI secretion system secreted protein VgrG